MRSIVLAMAFLALGASPAPAQQASPLFLLCTAQPAPSRIYKIGHNQLFYLYPAREGRPARWSNDLCDDEFAFCRFTRDRDRFTYDYDDEDAFELIEFNFTTKTVRVQTDYGTNSDLTMNCREILEPRL